MAETGKIFDADTDTVVAGVDTHLDTNMAAALNGIGGELGVKEFPTTAAGNRALLACWRTSAPWPASAWRAAAPMGPGWPDSQATPG